MKTKIFKQNIAGLIVLVMLWFVVPAMQAATGNLRFGNGEQYSLEENSSGTGWIWDAEEEILTLTAEYGGVYISIECAESDSVQMNLTGNVNIMNIYSLGSLTIDAGDYTLDCIGENGFGISVEKNISIIGGTINIRATNSSIYSVSGDINIDGNTNLTANTGLSCGNGSLLINTTGKVNIEGVNNTIYVSQTVTISSGSVFVNATNDTSIFSGSIIISGDANVTTTGCIYSREEIVDISTSGTVNIESSYIGIHAQTDIYISSGTINVTVTSWNSALYAQGIINISGGIVTLVGEGDLIFGKLNHTGGTINGQGSPSVPTVVTGTASDITSSSAIAYGSVTDKGGLDIIAKKIMCREGTSGTVWEVNATGSEDNFSAELAGLQANTLYNVCAAAQNSEGWGYGEWVEFTTEATAIDSIGIENYKVYPNPVKDILNISGLYTQTTVSLYDASGRLLLTKPAEGETMQIDMSDYKAGMYFLKVGGKRVKVRK